MQLDSLSVHAEGVAGTVFGIMVGGIFFLFLAVIFTLLLCICKQLIIWLIVNRD